MHACYKQLYTSASDFIWDFGKLPLPLHLVKLFEDFGKIIPKLGKYRPSFDMEWYLYKAVKWPNKITVRLQYLPKSHELAYILLCFCKANNSSFLFCFDIKILNVT